ncbi:MAG: hypothetical protein H6793_02060 [Candidatus Nomurabacteria bacterium]|nr:MAG: hypothetical protein H6793_02060 [Candidatus Nomurabacteria bacterium]
MEIEKGEHHRFAPLEQWREQQQTVSDELNALAQRHADRSNGKLTALPIDHDIHPAQRITTQSIDGTPTNIENMIAIAKAVNSENPERFLNILEVFNQEEHERDLVTYLGEDLLSKQNIIVMTNHSEIQDIAEALVACHIAIKTIGQNRNRDYQFSTNIILSKMIAHLGYSGIPAVDILTQMCDKQYFSFPKTDSIRGTNIPEKLVSAYNWSLRQRIKARLKAGGNLFGIAPSGTVDKSVVPGDLDSSTLAPVTRGTVEILTSDNTKVLPIAIHKPDDEFIFEILGTPRHMRNEHDVHETMESIADVLSSRSAYKSFTYRRPESS